MIQDWKLSYDDWNPEQEKLREALCTLGNGYFATRGAAEETAADDTHYPGTYLSAGYNRLESEIAGKVIENEDLVNWPNWLPLTFRPEGGEWLNLEAVTIEHFHQELDFHTGVLSRDLIFLDDHNRKTHLATRRLVSMADKNLAAIEWKLEALNWSGQVEIRSSLDAAVENGGVPRYQDLNSRHLDFLDAGRVGEEGIDILVQTTQSNIRMAQAARLLAFDDPTDQQLVCERETHRADQSIAQHLTFELQQHHPARIEKVVALFTSRDRAIADPRLEAGKMILRAGRFADLHHQHQKAWQRLWNRSDLQITNGAEAQSIIRFHVFHLLQTASVHTIDMDAGIPARGLHGEAYRGHIFWDELFIFPFLNFRIPDLTQALLMYRYRRLDEARHAAREAGYQGAMFPWQSGSNGREETQHIHLNPRSGRWIPDNTHLQRHINAAIAYNVWQYYQVTDDMEFLNFYGAEMILEIARCWASLTTFNHDRERYEIRGVVGPDEYHTRYPDGEQAGLNNNAYTNFMAVWVLKTALNVIDHLDESRREELFSKLDIPEDEMVRWDAISCKMYIPFLENGVISQFEGYENLEELDWDHYREKYGEDMRLDRILEDEGDSTNNYKAGKQADVLMLFYLFSSEELTGIFERLGYDFDPASIPDNIKYYEKRTAHGSTLSRIVFSWVWSRANREKSWYNFETALMSDLKDVQGGTTPEGIHLGAMAGTVDLVQRCYTGLEVRDDILWLNPALPSDIECLRFRIRYRSHTLTLQIENSHLEISFDDAWWSREIKVGVKGKVFTIEKGQTRTFDLEQLEREGTGARARAAAPRKAGPRESPGLSESLGRRFVCVSYC